ncbi:hypothetical protein PBY51_023227 [Eleginops maclovinus]|uniref:Uncharacterized protein n=1 Tax=Eleginops maclovinus TaxID=56733 RepID=A0AAN7WZJ5_ELEMC|nr:hypothetical protein PBY51_023227 [Eleginops maclovinus]
MIIAHAAMYFAFAQTRRCVPSQELATWACSYHCSQPRHAGNTLGRRCERSRLMIPFYVLAPSGPGVILVHN